MSASYNNRLDKVAEELAESVTDEEIVAHPSVAGQKAALVKRHKEEIKEELVKSVEELENDFALAVEQIHGRMAALPEAESESFRKEFRAGMEKMQTAGFAKECQQVLTEPLSENSSCLQWKLGLSEELINFIYGIGRELQEENKLDETKAVFRLLLSLNPYIPEFWGQFGLVFLKKDKFEEARNAFQMAQSLNPEDPLPVYLTALSFAGQHDVPETVKCCQEGEKVAEAAGAAAAWKPRFEQLKETAR